MRIVEIGVFEGVGTRLLADSASPGAQIYAIDPFIAGRLGICWGRHIALREIRKSSNSDVVRLIRSYSYEAVNALNVAEFDFVFVDGDHSLKGMARDWEDWSPRIAPNGIVALHDTRVPDHDPLVASLGSYRFFESTIRTDPRFAIIEQIDSLSVLQRHAA